MGGASHIQWEGNLLKLLDQRFLPEKEDYLECHTHLDVQHCIRDMIVRGAPAIGVAAGFAMVLAARFIIQSFHGKNTAFSWLDFETQLIEAGDSLKNTRPTAVNLSWAVDRMLIKSLAIKDKSPERLLEEMEQEAKNIFDEDIEVNKKIGEWGSTLIHDNFTILTHCNAGALATAGYGTALGVIKSAFYQGKNITVYADETRPFLQGSRLTAYELQKEGIPVFVIVDGAAGYHLNKGDINCIIVGADRVAANGDVANKIGTYTLAVLAKENNVPFYAAVPFSTIDMSIGCGKEIIVEERDSQEITHLKGIPLTPRGVKVKNPSFDITPSNLITALITEYGIIYNPNEKKMQQFVEKGGG
ncbi:MAG: S-methyl-5-thioribose-1-phosphate isomerase [Bacillota bacterium]|nr:S-methyl-5-thioribose-1-phosphate isomerase [Bacillota bacterium]